MLIPIERHEMEIIIGVHLEYSLGSADCSTGPAVRVPTLVKISPITVPSVMVAAN